MPKPAIDDKDIRKPICYDPCDGKYIFYEEVLSGKQKIIPIETLSDDDFKQLVIKRLNTGPDFTVQSISGPPFTRDDVVRAVVHNEPFGRDTLDAEKAYLRDFLASLQQQLNGRILDK